MGPPSMPSSRPIRPPAAVPTSSGEPTRSLTVTVPSAPRWTAMASCTSTCSCESSSLSLVIAAYAFWSAANEIATTL